MRIPSASPAPPFRGNPPVQNQSLPNGLPTNMISDEDFDAYLAEFLGDKTSPTLSSAPSDTDESREGSSTVVTTPSTATPPPWVAPMIGSEDAKARNKIVLNGLSDAPGAPPSSGTVTPRSLLSDIPKDEPELVAISELALSSTLESARTRSVIEAVRNEVQSLRTVMSLTGSEDGDRTRSELASAREEFQSLFTMMGLSTSEDGEQTRADVSFVRKEMQLLRLSTMQDSKRTHAELDAVRQEVQSLATIVTTLVEEQRGRQSHRGLTNSLHRSSSSSRSLRSRSPRRRSVSPYGRSPSGRFPRSDNVEGTTASARTSRRPSRSRSDSEEPRVYRLPRLATTPSIMPSSRSSSRSRVRQHRSHSRSWSRGASPTRSGTPPQHSNFTADLGTPARGVRSSASVSFFHTPEIQSRYLSTISSRSYSPSVHVVDESRSASSATAPRSLGGMSSSSLVDYLSEAPSTPKTTGYRPINQFPSAEHGPVPPNWLMNPDTPPVPFERLSPMQFAPPPPSPPVSYDAAYSSLLRGEIPFRHAITSSPAPTGRMETPDSIRYHQEEMLQTRTAFASPVPPTHHLSDFDAYDLPTPKTPPMRIIPSTPPPFFGKPMIPPPVSGAVGMPSEWRASYPSPATEDEGTGMIVSISPKTIWRPRPATPLKPDSFIDDARSMASSRAYQSEHTSPTRSITLTVLSDHSENPVLRPVREVSPIPSVSLLDSSPIRQIDPALPITLSPNSLGLERFATLDGPTTPITQSMSITRQLTPFAQSPSVDDLQAQIRDMAATIARLESEAVQRPALNQRSPSPPGDVIIPGTPYQPNSTPSSLPDLIPVYGQESQPSTSPNSPIIPSIVPSPAFQPPASHANVPFDRRALSPTTAPPSSASYSPVSSPRFFQPANRSWAPPPPNANPFTFGPSSHPRGLTTPVFLNSAGRPGSRYPPRALPNPTHPRNPTAPAPYPRPEMFPSRSFTVPYSPPQSWDELRRSPSSPNNDMRPLVVSSASAQSQAWGQERFPYVNPTHRRRYDARLTPQPMLPAWTAPPSSKPMGPSPLNQTFANVEASMRPYNPTKRPVPYSSRHPYSVPPPPSPMVQRVSPGSNVFQDYHSHSHFDRHPTHRHSEFSTLGHPDSFPRHRYNTMGPNVPSFGTF